MKRILSTFGLAALMTSGIALAQPVQPVGKGQELIQYELDGVTFESRFIASQSESKANVLMFPNWLGPDTEASVAKAELFAEKGYNVLLADVYGIDTRPSNQEEAAQASGSLTGDRELLRRRAQKALAEFRLRLADTGLESKSKPLAAIGFCFGGTTSLELARSGVNLPYFVSFHGNLSSPTPADAKQIKGSILVFNGADDPIVPASEIRSFEDEMTAASVDWTFVNFSNTVHSFTDPTANVPGVAEYNPVAAARAYGAMELFLQQ
ncbi:dienelactone hydrolase family protein [Pseudobacteriovorax antillogorgiicola]|nr:dienelactone hydrolase family protein [Pseudobacteriovorax antillogorgiicola]